VRSTSRRGPRRTSTPYQGEVDEPPRPEEDVGDLIIRLEHQMLDAAEQLEFEKAAELRDRIKKLRKERKG
jgi:excinuclease ABC subunit B